MSDLITINGVQMTEEQFAAARAGGRRIAKPYTDAEALGIPTDPDENGDPEQTDPDGQTDEFEKAFAGLGALLETLRALNPRGIPPTGPIIPVCLNIKVAGEERHFDAGIAYGGQPERHEIRSEADSFLSEADLLTFITDTVYDAIKR